MTVRIANVDMLVSGWRHQGYLAKANRIMDGEVCVCVHVFVVLGIEPKACTLDYVPSPTSLFTFVVCLFGVLFVRGSLARLPGLGSNL